SAVGAVAPLPCATSAISHRPRRPGPPPPTPRPSWPIPWGAAIPVGAEPAGADRHHISGSCPAAPDRATRPVPPPQSACATDQLYSGAPQARDQPHRCAGPPGRPIRSWPVLPDAPPPSDCVPAPSAQLSARLCSSAQSPLVPSDTSAGMLTRGILLNIVHYA